MTNARGTRAPAPEVEAGTRFPTVVGFVVGFLSFLVEFVVALAIGSADLTVLAPLAYIVFGVYALVAMGFAPSRPFQRGVGPGLAVAVLIWLTLFDTNTLDEIVYIALAIAGWAAGLELSRRRGRLPAELPPLGRRGQPRSTRRQ